MDHKSFLQKLLTPSLTIAPHQGAGFSGGRKNVLPGIASLATLKQHHGFTMRSDKPAMGAVATALAKHGKNAKIILMKNGSDMIPHFEGKPENA